MIALIASLPFIAPTIDEVDLIEINHVHSDQSSFTQLIFYDYQRGYDADKGKYQYRYQVVDWRMAKDENHYPRPRGKVYEAVFMDYGERLRLVRAKQIRETWTSYDVERLERQNMPSRYRRGLSE